MRFRAALAGALLTLSFARAQESATDRGPTWNTDLEQAAELARESGRPLLIVFR